MNRIIKRYITGNLEKTLYDAFVADTRSLNKSSKLYSPQDIFNGKREGAHNPKIHQKNRTITDKWLQDALNTKVETKLPKIISLQLPLILKTLQRLRATNNTHFYFKLMKKLNSTKIHWVTTSHATSVNEFEDIVPPEFYHELSNMLYKLSLRMKSFKNEDEIDALSKFTLKLISQYLELLEKTKSKTKCNSSFWRNVISVVLKSKSLVYKEQVLTLIDKLNVVSGDANLCEILKDYTNLHFYLETDQLLKLEHYIQSCLTLNKPGKSKKTEEIQLKLFCPLLVRTLQKYIMCGMVDSYDHLAKLMVLDYPSILDEHDIATIDNLCESNALTTLSTYLGLSSLANEDIAFNNLRASLLKQDISFLDILQKLKDNNIDPYSTMYVGKLDFAIFKVEGNKWPNLKYWKQEFPRILNHFKENKMPLPVQIFFVNTLMKNLVGDRYVGYVIDVLQMLYVDFKFDLPLGDCQKDCAMTTTGYHPLFKMVEYGTSAIMCSFELFEHMLKLKKRGQFEFFPEDFSYLLTIAGRLNDNMLFNYYFMKYLELYGHQSYDVKTKLWSLPDRLLWITGENFKFGISEESLKTIENMYIENGGKQLTRDSGERVFKLFYNKDDQTTDDGNKNRADSFKYKLQDVLRNKNLTEEGYSAQTDFYYADLLVSLLEYMETAHNPTSRD
ncbi:similar to Saccharomyces cerevisiae YOR350C MNE1 Mitochondrial matrix protein involved in splicing Group I aI5-beta intron from COX1 mRNA [Maudiozyma barnettii]|uniref:Similar to Saccharomyces cerevisiae YOR350C MNE1 Mitochondrial matrix protein involved in splicing Group I aI5-beta intron from COX1 mRNA n=1 Tax=Maudiozyma barnettii TaxID=61262 RepID=A0A8H2VG32_9SACH|nr:Mne1p [Kazachstania barnettii]CAB4254847.1 similar to Saccharomyces cerevisiae YOR350C MNE1 Mitochondrial matrix protein involved in splicing Group I aI5-beta intron from COX1 mRNA [Kazachstania barnettii]CAD1783055.1 similar to Saccharomyces cerevisiae YOR350C MNE1 Mitochondrial matrix protein involved in splicing Group I aI5-beta intron from COX1 mRNA [Kazachstania barnettii]